MPPCRNPLPLQLDLGDRDRVSAVAEVLRSRRRTLGTLAEREVDDAGDAVFGQESETNGLGSLGRLVFRTVLQVSDYLQSVTAEARSRKLSGADLLEVGGPTHVLRALSRVAPGAAGGLSTLASSRSAISGSTRLARSAGIRLATAAISDEKRRDRRERGGIGRARAEEQRPTSAA